MNQAIHNEFCKDTYNPDCKECNACQDCGKAEAIVYDKYFEQHLCNDCQTRLIMQEDYVNAAFAH